MAWLCSHGHSYTADPGVTLNVGRLTLGRKYPQTDCQSRGSCAKWPLPSKGSHIIPAVIASYMTGRSRIPPERGGCRIGWKTTAVASSRLELLVDGDVFSIQLIRSAISRLEQESRHKVRTTLFMEPERLQNKKWAEFVGESGVTFQAVGRRSVELGREPNDEAIVDAMQKLSGVSKVDCVALMTQDTGFIRPILALQDQGKSIMVLTEESRFTLISTYQVAGVTIVGLQPVIDRCPKVLAVLLPNGTGSVKLGARFQEPSYETFVAQNQRVTKLMKDLGYRGGGRSFSGHECAKFWCANGLGPLTVWPYKAAVAGVHDFVTRSSKSSWEPNSGKLAFVLPITKPSRITSRQLETYGSELAKAVFNGGGPFVLEDSPDLTAEALTKLGFLDDGLNADLAEAMHVFLNVAENKKALRKLGALPGTYDRCLDVDMKLREAFLSTASAGTWQIMRNQVTAMSPVVHILERAKALPRKADSKYSDEELFEAMKVYVEQRHLPRARTFNGLRFRVLRYNERKDPTMRMEVDFDRSWHAVKKAVAAAVSAWSIHCWLDWTRITTFTTHSDIS